MAVSGDGQCLPRYAAQAEKRRLTGRRATGRRELDGSRAGTRSAAPDGEGSHARSSGEGTGGANAAGPGGALDRRSRRHFGLDGGHGALASFGGAVEDQED